MTDDSGFDLRIISCDMTLTRLRETNQSIRPLYSTGKVYSSLVVLNNDCGYYSDQVFAPELWRVQIEAIYPILALNIRNSNGSNDPISAWLSKDPMVLFKPRHLSNSEKSLLWKHYTCLRDATRTTLTIEDDAKLYPEAVGDLLYYIDLATRDNCFIDLGSFQGLIRRGSLFMAEGRGISYYKLRIGCTRTTCAMIYSQRLAQCLADTFWPCALPADLHFQYLLYKLSVSGVWPMTTIFEHGSMIGASESSIQNKR